MVMLLADRLTSTSAPASAAWLDGGTGTQMSSQISTWKVTGTDAGRAEQQVGAERHRLAGELDLCSSMTLAPDTKWRFS